MQLSEDDPEVPTNRIDESGTHNPRDCYPLCNPRHHPLPTKGPKLTVLLMISLPIEPLLRRRDLRHDLLSLHTMPQSAFPSPNIPSPFPLALPFVQPPSIMHRSQRGNSLFLLHLLGHLLSHFLLLRPLIKDRAPVLCPRFISSAPALITVKSSRSWER